MNKWLNYFSKEEVAGFLNAENLYGKAYLICERVFDGKRHASGVLYMDHLLSVANRFTDDKAKVVALLHDIVKETELTAGDLNYIGFPSDIVKTVILMTREQGESYDEFINRIINSKNSMALQIKKVDLEQNMNLNNYETVPDEYLNTISVKYRPQYEKIIGYLCKEEEN